MKYLLYSFALVLTLGASHLSYAMDPDEPIVSDPHASPQRHSSQTEDWKTPFYKKKFVFSEPRLDMNALNLAIIKKQLDSVRVEDILKYESDNSNEAAQEKLYGFYTKQALGINLVNEQKADALLQLGINQKRTWAFWAKAKAAPEGQLTEWHCLAANKGHQAARDFVSKHLPFRDEHALDFLSKLYFSLNKPQEFWQSVKRFEETWSTFKAENPLMTAYAIMRADPRLEPVRRLIGKRFLQKSMEWCSDVAFGTYFEEYGASLSKNEWFEFHSNNALLFDDTYSKFNLANAYIGNPEKTPESIQSALKLLFEVLDSGLEDPSVIIQSANNAAHTLKKDLHGIAPDSERALQLYIYGAMLGDPKCACIASDMLIKDFAGQDPQLQQAIQLLLDGASKGSTECYFRIARLYHNGVGDIPADLEQALNYYIQGAKTDSNTEARASCFYNAGLILAEELEVGKRDKKKALEFYKEAIKLDHDFARNNAALLLFEGFKGQRPDRGLALKWMLDSANTGNLAAIKNTAAWFQQGFKGQKPNPKKAYELYIKGVNHHGDPECIAKATKIAFTNDELVQEKREEVLNLAKKAVELGNVYGMLILGEQLVTDPEATQDEYNEARKWFELAAQKGSAFAHFRLGVMWYTGKMEEGQDLYKVQEHFRAGMEKGDLNCKAYLGLLLMHHSAMHETQQKGLQIILESAQQGSIFSMGLLGETYLGNLGEKFADIDKSLFWLEKAASLGHEKSEQLLKKAQQYQEPSDVSVNDDEEIEQLLDNAEIYRPTHLSVKTTLESSSENEEDSHSSEDEGESEDRDVEPNESIGFEDEGNVDIVGGLDMPDELGISSELDLSNNPIHNPKYLREQLKAAGMIWKNRRQKSQSSNKPPELSTFAADTIQNIRLGQTSEVKPETLERLCQEDFFEGQIAFDHTKSGFCIVAHNRTTNKHFSTGSHRKHSKSWKGHIDPGFWKSFIKLLDLFPANPSVELAEGSAM